MTGLGSLACGHRKVTLTRERLGCRTFTCDTCGASRTHFGRWTGDQLRAWVAAILLVIFIGVLWAFLVGGNDARLHAAAECADTHAEPGTVTWEAAFDTCLATPLESP